MLPPGDAHRERFPGQHRLVDRRDFADERPVGRYDVALAYQKHVADRDLLDRNFLETGSVKPQGRPRNLRQQSRHALVGATMCACLQKLTAGIHETDDRSGKIFAEP